MDCPSCHKGKLTAYHEYYPSLKLIILKLHCKFCKRWWVGTLKEEKKEKE